MVTNGATNRMNPITMIKPMFQKSEEAPPPPEEPPPNPSPEESPPDEEPPPEEPPPEEPPPEELPLRKAPKISKMITPTEPGAITKMKTKATNAITPTIDKRLIYLLQVRG
jgi:hypothetical protein